MLTFKELLIIAIDTKPFELLLFVFLISALITCIIFYIFSKRFRSIIDDILFEEVEEEVIEVSLTKEEWEKLEKSISNVV